MPKSRKTFTRYGCTWPIDADPLELEFCCIRKGGEWKDTAGNLCGGGLFHHYRQAQTLLWPADDHHRWSDLMLATIVAERVTCFLGPKDTGKTRIMARYGLTDYFVYPETTLVLISSTEMRGMELRVWGDLKELLARAKELFPWLPGQAVDGKHGIFTDNIGENCEIRDMRKGLVCIPCVGGNGEWVGIEKWCGIKQTRRRLLADELQFMKAPYLGSMEHLDKGDYKFVGCANPIGQGDPADKISEPMGGWGSEVESEKTEVWRNRWGGVTVNLDGRDTPNNDPPINRYPYLISQEDIDRTANRRGKDSSVYWTQVIGKRKVGLNAFRVLTRLMCLSFDAFTDVIWSGSPTTKVYAIDASYGGDRCIAGWAEFGLDINNRLVLNFHMPHEIQIMMSVNDTAEDQIARHVRRDCENEKIEPSHVFFDSTGRGSLGTSFGRLWDTAVNPVEFGGTATTRPVAQGMYIFDQNTGARRLERCDEHYSKRVTEYWFSVRYVVESKQARNFPSECADEFGMREWYRVKGNRIELESKIETKERLGCSPDMADWAAIIVEGARRLGFTIDGLVDEHAAGEGPGWLEDMCAKHRNFLRKRELSYRR